MKQSLAAFAKLDAREEDQELSANLSNLIADTVRVVQTKEEISPEEFGKQLQVACPLFTERELQDEAEAVARIRNATRATLETTKSPEKRVDHVVRARVHIAEMLESLLVAGRAVFITCTHACNGRSKFLYEGSATGPTKHSSATDLEGCVEGLTDHPRRKKCVHCGEERPLWNYTTDRGARDGHSSACHRCEAKRVQQYQNQLGGANEALERPE